MLSSLCSVLSGTMANPACHERVVSMSIAFALCIAISWPRAHPTRAGKTPQRHVRRDILIVSDTPTMWLRQLDGNRRCRQDAAADHFCKIRKCLMLKLTGILDRNGSTRFLFYGAVRVEE